MAPPSDSETQPQSARTSRRSSMEMMKKRHVLYLVPTCPDVGLTSISLGLHRALDREGIPVGFFKPIRQPTEEGPERSTSFLKLACDFDAPEPKSFAYAESLLKSGQEGRLLQDIVEQFEEAAMDNRAIVVEGLQPTAEQPELDTLNRLISKALDAEIIIVSSLNLENDGLMAFEERVEKVANLYGGLHDPYVVGCIVNKFNAPVRHISGANLESYVKSPPPDPAQTIFSKCRIFSDEFQLLGVIPWARDLLCPRTHDLAKHLGANVIYEGEIMTRRVSNVKIVARTVRNMVLTLKANTFIITPGDRDDIILAASMAALNGVPLSGLVLTGGYEPDPNVIKLCEKGFLTTGLPLLCVESDSYVSAAKAAALDNQVPVDDLERIQKVMDYTAERLCVSGYLVKRLGVIREPRLSPAAFMYMLTNLAREKRRRILLPEGTDPRIIKAAVICHERDIAQCVLLGDPSEIHRLAEAQGVTIPSTLEIINPTTEFRMNYVDQMVELRKHKGLKEPLALAQLEDITVLGTMMLATGDVDGLVSGACHSTANTVRPALQLIKTRADAKLISSIFFMCLPNQVAIYGDCAINPDPNAEELADIALQSAASAEAFGIEPRVAMLSYSTGSSGKGNDVEKVREATRIAQERRPDLLIDGPMQYDAACTLEVAKSKAPDSKVAGRANVLIFPDLNTGNTTYKAVQRTANVVAVGPMLQGLRRPVNDLSRGALVDDIVYTIALTAIQAEQSEEIMQPMQPRAMLHRTSSLPDADKNSNNSGADKFLTPGIGSHRALASVDTAAHTFPTFPSTT